MTIKSLGVGLIHSYLEIKGDRPFYDVSNNYPLQYHPVYNNVIIFYSFCKADSHLQKSHFYYCIMTIISHGCLPM